MNHTSHYGCAIDLGTCCVCGHQDKHKEDTMAKKKDKKKDSKKTAGY